MEGNIIMSSPLELVEQHYRNVSSADIDAEDELFSPDVETVDPGAGTLLGLEAFKMYEQGFQRAFPDGKLVLRSAIESGNKVAVEGAYTGTHTGPLTGPRGEIPATQRPLNLVFARLASAESIPRWRPDVLAARSGGGPLRMGSEFDEVISFGGRKTQ